MDARRNITSMAYEARKPRAKPAKNLDIIGNKVTLSWGNTAANAMVTLEGISSGWRVNRLRARLNEVNSAPTEKSPDNFLFDGLDDNGPQAAVCTKKPTTGAVKDKVNVKVNR